MDPICETPSLPQTSAQPSITTKTSLIFGRNLTINNDEGFQLLKEVAESSDNSGNNYISGSSFMIVPVKKCTPEIALRIMLDPKSKITKEEVRNETALYKRIKHENIAPLLANIETIRYGTVQVLPLYQGDLVDYASAHTYNVDTMKGWILPICSALTYLHSNEIIHSDFKLENTLFTLRDGRLNVAITDFSWANAPGTPLHVGPGNCAPEVSDFWWEPSIYYGKKTFAGVTFSVLRTRIKPSDIWSLGYAIRYMMSPYPRESQGPEVEKNYISSFLAPDQDSSHAIPQIIDTLCEYTQKMYTTSSESERTEYSNSFCHIEDKPERREKAKRLLLIAQHAMQIYYAKRPSLDDIYRRVDAL